MNIIIRDLDRTRVEFEALVRRVGEGDATTAFRRALNHEGRKSFTAVRRALRGQTGIKMGEINAALRYRGASRQSLRAVITGTGRPMALRHFGARQFSYGVRAKPWGRAQQFHSAFIIDTLGGHVYKRSGKSRLPIEKLWGPSIPREMLRHETKATFEQSAQHVAPRAMHELSRLLRL